MILAASTEKILRSSLEKRQIAADVISEAYFTTMTDDYHDELAAMDLNRINMNFNSYASWLHLHHFCFVLFLFLNTKLYILYEC